MPSPLRQALACVAFVLAVVALADCTATPPSSRGAQARIAAAPMLHDVEALAADSMGGRGPGTEGDRMARATSRGGSRPSASSPAAPTARGSSRSPWSA